MHRVAFDQLCTGNSLQFEYIGGRVTDTTSHACIPANRTARKTNSIDANTYTAHLRRLYYADSTLYDNPYAGAPLAMKFPAVKLALETVSGYDALSILTTSTVFPKYLLPTLSTAHKFTRTYASDNGKKLLVSGTPDRGISHRHAYNRMARHENMRVPYADFQANVFAKGLLKNLKYYDKGGYSYTISSDEVLGQLGQAENLTVLSNSLNTNTSSSSSGSLYSYINAFCKNLKHNTVSLVPIVKLTGALAIANYSYPSGVPTVMNRILTNSLIPIINFPTPYDGTAISEEPLTVEPTTMDVFYTYYTFISNTGGVYVHAERTEAGTTTALKSTDIVDSNNFTYTKDIHAQFKSLLYQQENQVTSFNITPVSMFGENCVCLDMEIGGTSKHFNTDFDLAHTHARRLNWNNTASYGYTPVITLHTLPLQKVLAPYTATINSYNWSDADTTFTSNWVQTSRNLSVSDFFGKLSAINVTVVNISEEARQKAIATPTETNRDKLEALNLI